MQTIRDRSTPMARRLDPPARRPERAAGQEPRAERGAGQEPRQGSARRVPRRASRGPHGPVRWWERPAPDADEARWWAVQRLQGVRLARGITVMEVARRLAGIGAPLSRETLSRILNGKQATTWDTVHSLSEVLGVPVDVPPGGPGAIGGARRPPGG